MFITNVTQLKEALSSKEIFLSDEEIDEIGEVTKKYPMRISSYYLSLIQEKGDSIWNQCIPKIEELNLSSGEEDPLHEENQIPFLTHRYPDRCLLLISNSCAMYCRFCTRKRKVGEIMKNPTRNGIRRALEYIEKHTEIRDVILSGGDPFLLSVETLERILVDLRKIKHIEMIRIGTRVPCTMPERVTNKLCEMLKKYNKNPILYINTHFEHPREITEKSKLACERLIDVGIPLGNQSVVLKNINNKPEIFKELNRKLLSIGVKPYYIYQPDLVKGTAHFICPVNDGIKIIKGLRGHTSGMAVPHFVIDAPGGGGKIPLLPSYAKVKKNGEVEMKNYEGKKFEYVLK
ncbi:lysine 2,3-aminomutase [Candidatus Pacearchaeota archaeon CG10_big_fil_rev_8_21_14_0_10_32_42]|nr:MAG: lysine 2,3-aminomutase [Candidatus Pacearchaeota archaeon CG10_big_fil_rev_8_21_14_0_10_32_42]